jgi:KaiC/GvpD/RAD55 family RecA-like ATPase
VAPAQLKLHGPTALESGVNCFREIRMSTPRQAFGIDELDRELGGGLIAGTLTVVAGATGVGKTQLGLQWLANGLAAEGRRGVICDMTSRGDSQNHAAYASSLFGWELTDYPFSTLPAFDQAWDFDRAIGDYFHPIDRAGRRVTRGDLDPELWHEWKTDLARVLRSAVGFFYQQFARGSRRVMFDGLEPTERFSESIQFEFFEYIYHQVLRKDDEWAAREWFRERYRAEAEAVMRHRYDHRSIGCIYVYTTPQVMLEELLTQPIGQGDIFANANTIILMGRVMRDGRMGRALAIPKHRGSACGDQVLPYRITGSGLVFD